MRSEDQRVFQQSMLTTLDRGGPRRLVRNAVTRRTSPPPPPRPRGSPPPRSLAGVDSCLEFQLVHIASSVVIAR
jgi:hypothetical protein